MHAQLLASLPPMCHTKFGRIVRGAQGAQRCINGAMVSTAHGRENVSRGEGWRLTQKAGLSIVVEALRCVQKGSAHCRVARSVKAAR